MAIQYLKKSPKTSSTDDNKTIEIVQNLLKDLEQSIKVLKNGTKVANFSSPHPMTFEDGTRIEGYFEIAWSPPLNAIANYEIENPDVDIHCKYYEPANDFIGSNHYGDFSVYNQPRSFWETDQIGIDLDETFAVTEMIDEYNEDIHDESLDDDSLVDPEKLP